MPKQSPSKSVIFFTSYPGVRYRLNSSFLSITQLTMGRGSELVLEELVARFDHSYRSDCVINLIEVLAI